jgi:L-malate glycosyltransferase
MNILFISSLYPSQPQGSGEAITLALHHMTRYWVHSENVLVIRPVYIYLRELLTRSPRVNSGFFQRWRDFLHPHVLEQDNVKIIVFPIIKIPKIAYFYTPLYRFLDRYQKSGLFTPDIVVAHYNKSLDIGYHYSQRHQLPLVVGIHAAPDVSDTNPAAFTQRCGTILHAADKIACRSNFIYKKIVQWFPACRTKSFVAFSGIEAEIIADKSLAIEKLNRWKTMGKTKGTGGKISIITVSSLIDVKHVETNILALARLPETIDWSFTIIGEGPEQPRLEALTQSLGLHPRVVFKGQQPRATVLAELQKTDIFIMVSCLETFGLVYLEAMAAGNIVIGSEGEGIDGIIQHGQNGFLSPAGQWEPLAVLLEEIILKTDKNTLHTLLEKAHDTIQLFTDPNAAQHYLHQLKELVPK